MSLEFQNIKRTTTTKKKLMLWINIDICEAFEGMDPPGVTVQEKMRQVLKHFVEGGFDSIEAVPAKYETTMTAAQAYTVAEEKTYDDLADL